MSSVFHLPGVGDGVKFSGVFELLDPCVEDLSKGLDAECAEVPVMGSCSEIIGSGCGMIIVGSLHDDEGFLVDEDATKVAVMHVLNVETHGFPSCPCRKRRASQTFSTWMKGLLQRRVCMSYMVPVTVSTYQSS